jgi:hypothetical protein
MTSPLATPLTARTRAVALVVAALLTTTAVLATTACNGGPLGGPPMKTYDEIAGRPRLEEIAARYEDMQQRVRDALDAELGPLGWYQVREGSGSTCGHDVPPEFGGRSRFLAPWGFDAPFPTDRWPRIQQIVIDITGQYGFATAGLALDQPDYKIMGGVDPALGASYELSSKVNTTLRVSTGCHLPTRP